MAKFNNERHKYMIHAFSEHHITGNDLVQLTDSELKHDIGINVLGDRKAVLREIEVLKNTNFSVRYAILFYSIRLFLLL